MNQKELNEFHHRLALMMNEIHQICEQNHIRYTMIGGTLIGALRHKGFIPWDDDMDIAMPYEDYKLFCEVAFSTKHEWIEFALAGHTEDYYSPFIKAYDSRTTFMEGYSEQPRGIFIDIFPMVYAGNSKSEALNSFKRHRFYQSLLKRKAYHFDTGKVREWILTQAAKLCSVSFLMNKITHHYDLLNKKEKKYISDMDGTEKGIVPAFLFEEFVTYPFEEFRFYGIKKADEYLKLIFGNYMQLPPVDKQKPHHIELLDLNMPYRQYKKSK